jgi:hypothetical protein
MSRPKTRQEWVLVAQMISILLIGRTGAENGIRFKGRGFKTLAKAEAARTKWEAELRVRFEIAERSNLEAVVLNRRKGS